MQKKLQGVSLFFQIWQFSFHLDCLGFPNLVVMHIVIRYYIYNKEETTQTYAKETTETYTKETK